MCFYFKNYFKLFYFINVPANTAAAWRFVQYKTDDLFIITVIIKEQEVSLTFKKLQLTAIKS